MNYKMVGRFLAQILTVEGLFMIPAVIIGYVCGEDNAMQALLWSILIIAVVVAGRRDFVNTWGARRSKSISNDR